MITLENKTVSIKYYEQVLRLESNIIEVKMKDKDICIQGKDLQISYYTAIEIVVHGEVSSMVFK